MAESSNPAPAASRPRAAMLLLLALALAGALVYMLWPAAGSGPAPSNPPREQRRQAKATTGAQEARGPNDVPLDVPLDALKQAPVAPDDTKGRNPFKFYIPPPPPAPVPQPLKPGDKGFVAPPPPQPPPPVGPPPIPLKFIGTVEVKGRKVAVFVNSDGRGMPVYGGEGEIVLGQYRVVKIGVESVTVEYLDGRGRQTIPMRG